MVPPGTQQAAPSSEQILAAPTTMVTEGNRPRVLAAPAASDDYGVGRFAPARSGPVPRL